MDGILNPIPSLNRRLARIAFAVIALLAIRWFAVTPTTQAFTPPRFELESVSKPLPARPAGRGTTLVRPRARLLIADRSPLAVLSEAAEPNQSSSQPQTPDAIGPRESVAPPTGSVEARPAQRTGRPQTLEEALDRRGSVTFRKTRLSEVVFLLSDLWQINIVAGENVSGEVSGSFYDAPLREVLAAALTATGYSYRQTGNSLVVLPIDQVGADDPNLVSQIIQVPGGIADVDAAVEAAQILLGERGRIQKVADGAVLVVDSADRVDRVRKLFGEVSPPAVAEQGTQPPDYTPTPQAIPAVMQSGIAYFTPQFTEAEQMGDPLKEALGANVVVAVYPEENRIMVKGTQQELQLAKDAIAQLDVPRPQVRITALIYDVGLSELEQLGINWNRDLRALGNAQNEALQEVAGDVGELYATAADLTNTGLTRFGLRTVTNSLEASVFLEALDTTSEAKLLANPSITVGDRTDASIKIVRKIPIVGANPVENSNAVFTQTEFEEAGVILNVRPRISRDGTIQLQVQPEYSVVAEITSTGPVIDSRTADTTVRVADGQMFVLGGLRQKSVVESVRGIPYLKDLKYCGRLFRSHSSEVRESELIVFLKPELITPYDFGQPRDQRAAEVASQQLNAIPYASPCPQTPDCRDPNCPNHHPRRRINCGSSEAGMLGGAGVETLQGHPQPDGREQVVPGSVILQEASREEVRSPQRVPTADSAEDPPGSFPPVHIDSRFARSVERS